MQFERFVIRPSIAFRILEKSAHETTAIIYYDRGTRRIKLDLSSAAANFLNHFRLQGLAVSDVENLEGDARNVFELLRDRNMISSERRESWFKDPNLERFDRQLRLFSEILPNSIAPADVQRRIATARVLIVGLGGTGSHMLQGLAQLGVGNYLLVDPDAVEPSNLNRQPIYTARSMGLSKVSVAQDWINAFLPSANVETVADRLGEVTVREAAEKFQPTLIVNCADQPSVESTTAECIRLFPIDSAVPVLVAGGYFLLNSFSGPFVRPGRSACLSCGSSHADSQEHISAVGGNAGFVAALGTSIALTSALAAITGIIDNPLEGCQMAIELPEFVFTKKLLTINASCNVCGEYQNRSFG